MQCDMVQEGTHHLHTIWQLHGTCDVCSSEIELRAIVGKKWGVAATLILG